MAASMNEPPQELLDDMLPGEKAYPIFDLNAKWTQDRTEEDKDPAPWQTEGLPENRLRNSISCWTKMPTLNGSLETTKQGLIKKSMTEWWLPECKKNLNLNLADLEISATFRRWEVWCIEWFQHWTWDVGLSDEKVLESFSRYVFRTEILNERAMANGSSHEPYCLMGAENRHRWRGTETGAPDEETDPPCRCPHCKAAGVVRIAH